MFASAKKSVVFLCNSVGGFNAVYGQATVQPSDKETLVLSKSYLLQLDVGEGKVKSVGPVVDSMVVPATNVACFVNKDDKMFKTIDSVLGKEE